MKLFQLAFLFLYLNSCLLAQNFDNGFNFVLPAFDGTSQNFLPEFPAYTITETHRVTAGNDGKFYSNGQPIRFWGINMAIGANFPSTTDAAGVANRMRKMGINIVRIHHADSPSWGGPNSSLFLDGTQGTRTLNPTTLDQLDYFIFQLKQNGIFVDLELNVSRKFQESDGVIFADSLDDLSKPEMFFDPIVRDLQKEFAEQLLTHVNPYTNLTLAEDPVVATLEMNNETTLMRYWKSDYLHHFNTGGLMLYRHEQMLDGLWNDWLVDKYSNHANLVDAWGSGGIIGDNLLEDGNFDTPLGDPWLLELSGTVQAAITLDNQMPYGPPTSGRLDVTQGDENGNIQFKNVGFSLEEGKTYELAFAARADATYDIFAIATRDNAPFNFYGGFDFTVTPDWQAYFFFFTASEDNNGNGRIAFNPDNQLGQFWFDNVSVYEVERQGLLPNEDLASRNIQRIRWGDKVNFSNARIADLTEFYLNLQKEHFDDLRNYLINDLNTQMPITGTNALAGATDASTQADMDYIDDHSYWEIPVLEDGDFNSPNWYIPNQPMVQDELFSAITVIHAGQAVANKPYTISEYNHCFPNIYRAEMMPFLVSYCSYHGTDGIMLFDYNTTTDWTQDYVDRYFTISRDHSVMGMFPSFAYAFREGLIQENTNPILLNYNQDWINESTVVDQTTFFSPYVPFDERLTFTHTIQTNSFDAANTTDFSTLPAVTGSPYTTQTGQTTLDTDLGLLKTASDRFITMGGFLNDAASESAGDLTLTQADGFGVISWLSLTERPLNTTQKSILTLSSRVQNTGMIWNNDNQTVNNNFGAAPTAIQPLQATIRLNIDAEYIRLYPLNELGAEQNSTQIFPVAGNTFEVQLNQVTDQTIWWGIEAVGGGIVLSIDETLNLQAFAEKSSVRLEWQMPKNDNASFKLQKSIDAQEWSNFVDITPKPNQRYHQFFDQNPVIGQNYYRIEQTDADGNVSFSNTAEVAFQKKQATIQITPNPATTQIKVGVKPPLNTFINWEVTDWNGKVLKQGRSKKTNWTIATNDLAKGIYIIRFRDENGWKAMKKMVVQ